MLRSAIFCCRLDASASLRGALGILPSAAAIILSTYDCCLADMSDSSAPPVFTPTPADGEMGQAGGADGTTPSEHAKRACSSEGSAIMPTRVVAIALTASGSPNVLAVRALISISPAAIRRFAGRNSRNAELSNSSSSLMVLK